MRYGKPIKNKKRIDPRYFLNETATPPGEPGPEERYDPEAGCAQIEAKLKRFSYDRAGLPSVAGSTTAYKQIAKTWVVFLLRQNFCESPSVSGRGTSATVADWEKFLKSTKSGEWIEQLLDGDRSEYGQGSHDMSGNPNPQPSGVTPKSPPEDIIQKLANNIIDFLIETEVIDKGAPIYRPQAVFHTEPTYTSRHRKKHPDMYNKGSLT